MANKLGNKLGRCPHQGVAAEKKIPVVDLHDLSFRPYDDRGDAATAPWSVSPGDRTFFSRVGALEIAGFVAFCLPGKVPALRIYLRQPREVPRE